jgi:hypothetical protein
MVCLSRGGMGSHGYRVGFRLLRQKPRRDRERSGLAAGGAGRAGGCSHPVVTGSGRDRERAYRCKGCSGRATENPFPRQGCANLAKETSNLSKENCFPRQGQDKPCHGLFQSFDG